MATVVGFLCGIGNEMMSRKVLDTNRWMKTLEVGVTQDMIQDYETRRSSIAMSRAKLLSTIGDGNTSTTRSLPGGESGESPPEATMPLQTRGRKGLRPTCGRHKLLPGTSSSPVATPQTEKEETKHPEEEQETKRDTWFSVFDLFSGCKPRQSRSHATADLALIEKNVELHNANRVLPCSKSTSHSAKTSSRPSTPGGFRQVDAGTRSKLRRVTVPIGEPRSGRGREWGSSERQFVNGPSVHWKLALVAALELALKAISDQLT